MDSVRNCAAIKDASNEKTGRSRPALLSSATRQGAGQADQKGRDMFAFEIIGVAFVALSLFALVRNDIKITR